MARTDIIKVNKVVCEYLFRGFYVEGYLGLQRVDFCPSPTTFGRHKKTRNEPKGTNSSVLVRINRFTGLGYCLTSLINYYYKRVTF